MSTISDEREELIDVKEAARRLGLARSAVYRAVAYGRLAVVRLGDRGAIRVPAAALAPREKR